MNQALNSDLDEQVEKQPMIIDMEQKYLWEYRIRRRGLLK